MPQRSLTQRTIYEDVRRIRLRLPLAAPLAALGSGAGFPLTEDPRDAARTTIVGMMVLRPASSRWNPPAGSDLAETLTATADWCYDVAGVGGSWPISGGNALDAYRLALQYGTVDAVLAGAATV